jgi:PAS domain S-box-containing protein
MSDISGQEQANRALREGDERFRVLFEQSLDMVSVVDAAGLLLYASPSHERVLGYAPAELVGKKMLELVHALDLHQVQDALLGIQQEPGAQTSVTFRIQHKDGSWRWLESTGRNLLEDPVVGGIVSNSRDITVRVQAEQALQGLRRELEVRVQDRTAELERANEALRAEIAKREEAQQESERSRQRESVLNALLRISMEDIPLSGQLERALDEILSIPWLPVLPQGAILLVGEDPGVLELQISRGQSPAFQVACARVKFGQCLCGRAAEGATIQFAAHVDGRHEIDYEGMEPHGHYCIPILAGQEAIGTLVLYLDDGHQQDADEMDFLQAAAYTLAGIIQRKRGEEALRDSERRYRLLAENATDMISEHDPEGIYLYASPACLNMLGYEPEELIGRSAYEFFHPADLEAIRRSHSTIVEQPTVYTVTYRIRHSDGSYLWVETTSKTIRELETGQVKEILAITRDITARRQAEEALHASERRLRELYAQLEDYSHNLEAKVAARTREIEQRRQVAESLRGMLAVLNSDLPLDEILEHIVAEASRLLGSDSSAIYRLERDEGTFAPQTVRGLVAETIAGTAFPPDLSTALQRGEPVTVPDVTAASAGSDLLSTLECLEGCCHALLAVPLTFMGEVYGGLVLYYSEPRVVSEEEIDLAVAFADQAALAIENARLHEQAREAGVMEERARLARELHDSLTQALFSMTLLAEAGQRLAGAGDLERVQAYLGRLGETSQQSLKEMRLLVYELRPLALESVGLVGALQHRLDAVEARTGVEARLLVEGTVQAPALMEEDLYRIAEQALNNTLKHAAATAVTARLRGDKGRLTVEVIDNGCGFDPKAVKDKGGQGLMSMRERAARIDGVLTVLSTLGQGTTVRVEVEIPSSAGDATGSP